MLFYGLVFAAAYVAAYLLLLAGSLLLHLAAVATRRQVPGGWFNARRVSGVAFGVAVAVVAYDAYRLSTSPLNLLN